MRDEDIHVGDILYIKEWDEMLQDGQLNKDGDIEFPSPSTDVITLVFYRSRKDRCGSKFTVKKLHIRPYGILYESKEDSERGAFAAWLTSKLPHFETASDDEIRLLLS